MSRLNRENEMDLREWSLLGCAALGAMVGTAFAVVLFLLEGSEIEHETVSLS